MTTVEIAGSRLPNIPSGRMPVVETFVTVQGEGVNLGIPSIFVRLGICNLKCQWCDTPYTWDFGRVSSRWRIYGPPEPQSWLYLTPDELGQHIRNTIGRRNVHHIVFTGGEPMIWQTLINKVVDLLPEFSVEVESNATIRPLPETIRHIQYFDLSPKLDNSGNPSKLCVNPTAIREYVGIPTAYFKFVIEGMNDIIELEEKYVRPFNIPPSRVLLMPEGTNNEEIIGRSAWMVGICKEKGYRLTTRLHILMYGDMRGV